MKKHIRIAKQLLKIAKLILGYNNDDQEFYRQKKIIVNSQEFEKIINQMFYDDLHSIGRWKTFDAYLANTRGKDHLYRLIIYVKIDGVYYEEAILTQEDIERDPKNIDVELKGETSCYASFPFNIDTFEFWFDDKIYNGIKKGNEVLKKWKENHKE